MFDLSTLIALAGAFGRHLPEVKRVAEYLTHYGYIDPRFLAVGITIHERIEHIKRALALFQSIAGVNANGEIDVQTLAKMTEPRCGCTDAQRSLVSIEEARWRKNRLTYFVAAYVRGISQSDQDDLIRLAWNDWQAAADVVLTPVMSQQGADIVISTGRGPSQGMDGGGGTLAWAFLPNGSDQQLLMRFDIDERWVAGNPQGGILFRNVACHEFGHLLGLDHSRTSSALMAPFYSAIIISPQANDDIPRIRQLYGAAQTPVPPPPTPAPPVGTLAVKIEAAGYKPTTVELQKV
jgi:hypothetical protein